MAGHLARLWHGPEFDYAQLQAQAVRDANAQALDLLVVQVGPALDMNNFGRLAWDIVRDKSPQMRDTLRYLVTTYGLSPNTTFPVYLGADEHTNLLQRACDELNIDVVELLLRHGADVMCPGLEQNALEYLTQRATSMPMGVSRYSDRYMPLISRLREAGCPDIGHLDFSRRKYRHPAVPPAHLLEKLFEDDYAWPNTDVPVNDRTDQVSWVEETGSSFAYQPLPQGQIRLVELQASADPSDPMSCRIVHSVLGHTPAYEVLSIANDQSTTTLPITIDGKTLEVPHAVWDALHRVRRVDGSRLLWVEAISIDSDNFEEHTTQVALRSTIYARASRALVWLGAAEADSRLVFEHLDECRATRKLNWTHYRGSARDAFHQLCQRPWFYQIDSALVAAFSRDIVVLCGDDGECSFQDILRCTSFRQDYHPLHGIHGPNQLGNLQAIMHSSGPMEVIRYARFCENADLARLVIGVASILGTTKVMSAISNTRAPELARSLVQHTISESKNLSILHYAAAGASRVQDGPSWVPDFSRPETTAPFPRVFGSYSYHSGHPGAELYLPWILHAEPQFHENGDLTLQGVLCGKIQAVGEPLTPISSDMAPGSKQFRKVMRGWEVVATSHLSNNGRKRFSQSVADAFADTIRAYDDAEQIGERRPSISSCACNFVDWYKQYGSGVLSSKEAAYFDEIETINAWQTQSRVASGQVIAQIGGSTYAEAVERATYGRRFFVTDNGTMGLAPAQSKAGDRLIFFKGGLYPWVIRARADGQTYELIGDCFLYDFQVVDIFRDPGVETRKTITLS